MNKSLAKILSLTLILFSVSCSKSSDIKIKVFKYNQIEKINNNDNSKRYLSCKLDSDDLSYLIDNEYDFPLICYNLGCGTCDTFSNIYEGFLNETKIILPTMRINLFSNVYKGVKLTDTSFLIFKKGKLVYKDDKISDEVFLTSEFKSYVLSKVIDINCEIINDTKYDLSQLDSEPYIGYKLTQSILNYNETSYETRSVFSSLDKKGKTLFVDSTKVNHKKVLDLVNENNVQYLCYLDDNLNNLDLLNEVTNLNINSSFEYLIA